MTIVDILRQKSLGFATSVAPFVFSIPIAYEYASWWTDTFGAPDDSENLRLNIRQMTRDSLNGYAEMDLYDDMLVQPASFFFNDAEQITTFHVEQEHSNLTSTFEYGFVFGVSKEDVAIVDGYEYLPLIESIPNIRQEADVVGASKPKGMAGSIVLRNQAHINPETLVREGMLDFIITEKVHGNDVIISKYADGIKTELASAYIEKYSYSQQQVTIDLQDKRKRLEFKVPTAKFSASEFPKIKDGLIGKPIGFLYGTVAALDLTCVNENDSAIATFRLPDGLDDVGTVEIESDSLWRAASGYVVSQDKRLITIPGARSSGGSISKVRLVGPRGYNVGGSCTPRMVIEHLLERFLGLAYTSSNYNIEQWEAEAGSVAAEKEIGIYVEKEIELDKLIFQVSFGGGVPVRVWFGGDGRITAKVKDYARASSRLIASADIRNADDIKIETVEKPYSSVLLKFNHNYSEDTDVICTDNSYEHDVRTEYRQLAVLEIETHLISADDARARAAEEARVVSNVPHVAEVELAGNLDVEIYDVITVTLMQDNLDASARQFAGNKDTLVLAADPDPESGMVKASVQIVPDREPKEQQSALSTSGYAHIERPASTIELLEQQVLSNAASIGNVDRTVSDIVSDGYVTGDEKKVLKRDLASIEWESTTIKAAALDATIPADDPDYIAFDSASSEIIALYDGILAVEGTVTVNREAITLAYDAYVETRSVLSGKTTTYYVETGQDGQRTVALTLYKWASTIPTDNWPIGSSIYNWSSTEWTLPSLLNGWTKYPENAGGPGQTLYAIDCPVTDADISPTTEADWPSLPIPYAVGMAGPQGPQGPQGYMGPQGVIGPQGLQGQQGPIGAQGNQGTQGNIGSQGPVGAQGNVGAQGSAGPQGAAGPQGNVGTQGQPGATGPQGYQGTQGAAGAQGLQGSQGLAGSQGAEGPQGVQGPGYSAVSSSSHTIGTGSKTFVVPAGLAYKAGQRARCSYTTTPANWMEGMITSYSGTNLVITIDLVSGSGTYASWGIGIGGERGAQGYQGPQGNAGVQGAAGPQGAVGSQGATGAQGLRGYQGYQGYAGVQGAAGPQGSQGVQGAAGAQGPMGSQGLQGSQGAIGSQGNQGSQGTQGSQGPIGLGQWTPVMSGGVVMLNGTTLRKASGTTGWNAQAYSVEGYKKASIKFRAESASGIIGMIGFNSDPSADASYTSLDFAFYLNNGTLQIYESSNNRGSFGSYDATTQLSVVINGAYVKYYKDFELIRTVVCTPGTVYYLDSSFYTVSASVGITGIDYRQLVAGAELAIGTVTAEEIDVGSIFALDIEATGSITGATLKSVGGKTKIARDVVGTYDGILGSNGDVDNPANGNTAIGILPSSYPEIAFMQRVSGAWVKRHRIVEGQFPFGNSLLFLDNNQDTAVVIEDDGALRAMRGLKSDSGFESKQINYSLGTFGDMFTSLEATGWFSGYGILYARLASVYVQATGECFPASVMKASATQYAISVGPGYGLVITQGDATAFPWYVRVL